MNYPEDPKTQIEMQLHEQYAINSNAILGSMLTLFVALLAVIGTYGYVFLRTESFQCVSCAEFTLADLRYTATASIFVLAIIAWLSITAGYRQRKEQFITDAIRKQYYTKEEFNKIYPQGYEPINKKWLIKPMTFPYGTFFWISVFTSVTIILSLFLKSKPGIYEEKAGKVLITSIIIVVFFIGVKLFLAHRMYKKYERNHKDKLLFIGEKVNSKEKKHCNIIKIKFMKHLNSITAKVKGLFSKFFAVLALMLVTVGAYGTTYTDKAKSTYRSSSIDLTDKKVTVTMMRNGTYKFVLSSVQINGYSGVLTLADFTINGVTGMDNDDGSVSYSYSGNATTTNCSESILYGFTEGGTMAVEMTGTSRNGKLYMMLTISTVSTVYTFGEEITINKMVTYTANATSSTNSGTTLTAHKNKVVKVVETDNGIYKFVMEDVELCAENNSTLTIGDFEINGVKGTIDSEGYVNYSFDGNAITTNVSSSDYFESLSEGGKLAVTLEGKSKDGELYFVLKSELRRFTSYSCSTLYRFYDTGYYVYSFNDPVVEGDVIGTDGYKSTGSTFNNSFSINLSSQKFVAHIDLYTCKNDNENVLSIGSSTSSSDSNAGNIHLYYSPSTKTLLCQYVYATNKYTAKLTDIEESMTVELSEVYGLLVNGTEAFNPSLLTPLFEWSGPNPLLCGSYGGSAKSNATYKFFRKKDLPYSPSTYTANAQEVYDGVTLDLKNQTVRIVQTAEDTYTVIYSNVILGTTKIGNLTAKGVKGTSEFDGYVVYSFDGNAVISNVDTTNVVLAAYGIKNGATLPFKIEGRSFDGVLKAKFTATFNKKDGEIFFNGYSGTASLTTENYIGYVTWSFSSPAIFPAGNYRLFDQTVKITKADDGTYTVVYKNCCELGDFTAKGVKGTTDADGNTSYSFTGKATLTNVSERAVSRYSLAEGQEMAFIMKGSSNLNGELEAEFSTSLKNSPLIINYTPFKTYIADAAINSGDSVYNATDQIVKIAKTAENTYIVLYKDLTIGSKNIGDFTFSDVTGTPDADGNIYYSCVSDNCDTFVGSSKNGKLVAKFAINGYGEISYNGFAETSTDTYTANVVRYNSYNGSLYVDKTQTVSITANNAGSYKFVYLLYTIDGVTKTKNSDGCESFVFNGKGKYYSYVKSVSLEATRQDGIVHMALNEEIYFGADSYNFDATSTYNGNAVELTDQKLIIAKTANDTYKFIYKDLTLGSNKIGHFTASGVKGTTDADGNLNFSYNGNATVTNVNSELSDYITEGGTLPFKIEGKLVNGSLIAKFTITYNGSEGVIRYNGYDETYEPTVIITAKNATREYGDANPTLEYEVTGGTLDGVPELECTAAQSSPVGTYVITVKSGTVKNSNVTYVDGTLTVTKAPLVISAGTYSKKQGEVMPTFEASYSGFKNSETEEVLTKQPELTTTATETSEPGEYEVTVSGAEAENYSITYESGKLVVSASDPEPDPEPEERTDGTVVGTDGYQPAGESFVWNASIDWETQRLVASIDVSGCTGKYENLLSVGDKIEDWCGNHVHIYYTRNDAGTGGNVLVYYMNAIDAISCATFDMDGDDLRIIISKKKGITVNGKSFNYKFADYFTNGGDPITDTSGFYAALWALSDIQVGSQEGGTRSNATYNYIRVQDLVSPTEPDPEPDPEPEERKDGTVIGTDGYQPAGASFVWNASIDWETQKLVASIDVSTCLSSTTCENILSVGSDISSWADGEKFHIYYTQSSKTLTIWYIDNWEYKIQHKEVSVSDDVLRVEISKEKGLVVNGEDFNDGNDVATTYEELWKLSDIQVGSQEGVNRSNATYNYIRVQDLIKPDVPTAINAAALNGEADIYTLSGVKVNELQKGINIVRMNGKTMKIVKR